MISDTAFQVRILPNRVLADTANLKLSNTFRIFDSPTSIFAIHVFKCVNAYVCVEYMCMFICVKNTHTNVCTYTPVAEIAGVPLNAKDSGKVPGTRDWPGKM